MLQQMHPAGIWDGRSMGMSQGMIDTSTGLMFLSGQVAWDQEAQVRGTGVGEQTEYALKNLATALASAGASSADILHMRIYVRGECAEHLEAVQGPLATFLDGHFPAMTGIGVASLATPDTLIEIEVVARVPSTAS